MQIFCYFQRDWEIKIHYPFVRKYVIPNYYVSRNKSMPVVYILSQVCIEQNTKLYGNNYITEKLLSYLKIDSERMLDWDSFCDNSDLVLKDIIDFSLNRFRLEWYYISKHPSVTIDLINGCPHAKWDWFELSRHPGITMQDITNHPEYPWSWDNISANPNLNLKFIKQYRDKEWNWYAISSNPGITMQDITNHPEYPWTWNFVSSNPNLTMNMIKNIQICGILIVLVLIQE